MPRLGFQRFYSEEDFSEEAGGWLSKDEAFFRESLDRIEQMKRPFFAYLITMQSHGPFGNHGGLPEWMEPPPENELRANYLATMHEVDQALAFLFGELDRRGLSRTTLVMLYADHLAGLDGFRVMGHEKIPLYMLHPKLEPQVLDRVGSHVDLAPTVTHLLRMAEPKGWLGSSLFSRGAGGVLFNNGDFVRRQSDGTLESAPLISAQPYIDYSFSVLH